MTFTLKLDVVVVKVVIIITEILHQLLHAQRNWLHVNLPELVDR